MLHCFSTLIVVTKLVLPSKCLLLSLDHDQQVINSETKALTAQYILESKLVIQIYNCQSDTTSQPSNTRNI